MDTQDIIRPDERVPHRPINQLKTSLAEPIVKTTPPVAGQPASPDSHILHIPQESHSQPAPSSDMPMQPTRTTSLPPAKVPESPPEKSPMAVSSADDQTLRFQLGSRCQSGAKDHQASYLSPEMTFGRRQSQTNRHYLQPIATIIKTTLSRRKQGRS